jgi:signal transduction histidine kinase
MAETHATFGLSNRLSFSAARWLRRVLGNVRVIVVGSLLLISGCFAAAALIQMRLDRAHALSAATDHEAQRAQDLAETLSDTLERYAAIGTGFASASLDAESAATLAEAGGAALLDAVVLDNEGHLISELKGAPQGLLPLSPQTLAEARSHRMAIPAPDGRSLALLLPNNGRIAAIQLDTAVLIARRPDALIALPSGRVLAAGAAWRSLPDIRDTVFDGRQTAHIVNLAQGARILAMARISNWPVIAGASVASGDALMSWRGALPLYLFIILGPALAGAGLAAVFVHEFERRIRAAEAARALRAKNPEEARLLVRLADAERRAVQAERAKAEFMSHMSHELRTPLNAIIGFAEAMQTGALGDGGNPKHAEYARHIGTAGRQLHVRIRDILDFADMDARRRPLRVDTIDVSQLAREALESVRAHAREKGIAVLIALPQASRALGDAEAVKQIFERILANAVQFTPNGGEIRVSARSTSDGVVTQVKDTGLGFTDDEKGRATEAFQRFDRSGHATGLGLGLAVATTLARRMGGSLRIDGRQGEGATVELRLPSGGNQPSHS